MPGFVAVDLAQPVLGAVLGQPCCGIGVPDVDCVPRHVRRRVGRGDPSRRFPFGSVLGNRLTKELVLVLRRTPPTIDEELDPVVRCMSCSPADGTEQIGVELSYSRNLVIKNRRAVRHGTVRLAKRTTVLVAQSTVVTATGLNGECRRRR